MSQGGVFRRPLTIFNGNTGSAVSDDDELTIQGSAPVDVTASGADMTISLINSDAGTITSVTTDGTLSGDSDTAVPTEQAVKTYVDQEISGINAPSHCFYFDAAALASLEDNFTAPSALSGTTIRSWIRPYDDSGTSKWNNLKFPILPDIDSSGTVTFRIYVAAETAASANTQFRFSYFAASDGSSWDGTYSNVDSGDISITATTNALRIFDWTSPVSSLTDWEDPNFIFWRIARIPATSNDLTDDARVFGFSVFVPRTWI